MGRRVSWEKLPRKNRRGRTGEGASAYVVREARERRAIVTAALGGTASRTHPQKFFGDKKNRSEEKTKESFS